MGTSDALLIDAGTGNLHSVHNALQVLGFTIQVSSSPEAPVKRAERVDPASGAFQISATISSRKSWIAGGMWAASISASE